MEKLFDGWYCCSLSAGAGLSLGESCGFTKNHNALSASGGGVMDGLYPEPGPLE